MMNRKFFYYGTAVAALVLSACAAPKTDYTGANYPPTDQVESIFQISQAPQSCRVIGQLFAAMPAGMPTAEFDGQITTEAKSRGADLMLIGESRQCTTQSALKYSYYGPKREYKVADWHGWSFGEEEWGKQGNWTAIGYNEWAKNDVRYDYPVLTQVAFLRCR